MDCKQVEQLLNDYLENRLTGPARQMFDSHCARCARCAAVVNDCSANIVLIKQLHRNAVPESLDQKVYRALSVEVKHSRRGFLFPLWKAALPLAAAAMVVIGLYYTTTRKNTVPFSAVLSAPGGQSASQPLAAQVKPADTATNETEILQLAGLDIKSIETILKSMKDKENAAFLGAAPAISDTELRAAIDGRLNAVGISALPITGDIKAVLYRRAKRVGNLTLLKNRNIIAQDADGMLYIVRQGYGVSKADAIMLEDENSDRRLLLSIYLKNINSTPANPEFRKIPPQDLIEKITTLFNSALAD